MFWASSLSFPPTIHEEFVNGVTIQKMIAPTLTLVHNQDGLPSVTVVHSADSASKLDTDPLSGDCKSAWVREVRTSLNPLYKFAHGSKPTPNRKAQRPLRRRPPRSANRWHQNTLAAADAAVSAVNATWKAQVQQLDRQLVDQLFAGTGAASQQKGSASRKRGRDPLEEQEVNALPPLALCLPSRCASFRL